MKKRMLAALLAVCMSAGALAGCSSDGSSASQSSSSSTASGSTASTEGGSSSAAEGGSGTAADDPKLTNVKFSLAYQRMDAAPQLQEVQIIKDMMAKPENANVEIEWIDWPSSAVAEKKSLAFASGEYPDAVMGAWVTDTAEVVDYSNQGFLVPIEQYYGDAAVMPNLAKILEQRPDWKGQMTSPDGHIYTLFSISEVDTRTINDTLNVNTEWLEKVGLEIPTTTDEFYNMLKTFKGAGDINGNGESDEIPMLMRWGDHMRGYFSLMGSWGLAGSQSSFTIRDGKAVYNYTQDSFKEALKYFNKLYSEGLMDPECFTVTSAAYVAKANSTNPMAGAMVNWSSNDPNNAVGREVWKMIPPLKAVDGVEPVWQARTMPLISNHSFFVTDKAENVEGILHWVDQFYETTMSIENFYGQIDKFLTKVGDNTYDWIPNANGNNPTYEERYPFALTNRGVWCVLQDDFKFNTKTQARVVEEESMAIYDPYVEKTPYIDSWLTAEESTELTTILVDIQEYVKNQCADFVANGKIDEGWDSYIAKLDQLGLPKYIEIKQASYDRSKAN